MADTINMVSGPLAAPGARQVQKWYSCKSLIFTCIYNELEPVSWDGPYDYRRDKNHVYPGSI